jgi:hypothetical protein
MVISKEADFLFEKSFEEMCKAYSVLKPQYHNTGQVAPYMRMLRGATRMAASPSIAGAREYHEETRRTVTKC